MPYGDSFSRFQLPARPKHSQLTALSGLYSLCCHYLSFNITECRNLRGVASSLSRPTELIWKLALVRCAIRSVRAGWLYSNDRGMWLAAQGVMGHINLAGAKFENVATPRTFNKHPCESREFWEWWPTRNDVPFNAMRAVNEADRGHLTPGRPKAWRLAISAAPVKSDR